MGYFISFEGPDGSGKTTVTQKVADYLAENYDVIYTREPGGIEISEKIRDIILDPNHSEMDDRTEALLYAASRRQHLTQKIIPALEDNKIVVCDRFIDSSLAYQGYARGIGMEDVFEINRFAIENYMPDLTIFLDIDPLKGLQRIHGRDKMDRLELAGDSFHTKVYEGYLEVLKQFPNRIKVVNADQSEEDVFIDVIAIINHELQD
ncbi:dTMP kinase [Erysipelothrix inopinata]|uniref:Thymidylate kinase n=1 Tax=Erysipelothrix inopinata TaxID=225084 RepID=A0A7G9S0E7_9FIRM|nr:dTMP kinase [Erysipelothrix inopinata]QNN61322.1 dTMP kinase [Erysipelothrix inopinata]